MPDKTPVNNYPPKSAGRLAVQNVPVAQINDVTADIIETILEKNDSYFSISHIYILDGEKLVGTVPLRKLITTDKSETVNKIMTHGMDFPIIKAGSSGEKVGILAIRKKLTQVPVVDSHQNFIGVVPYEKILKIIKSEALEDLLHLGGISTNVGYDDVFADPLKVSLKHRLPWLFIGLFGGLTAASFISSYEHTLSQNLILASFIPLIVYMTDAIGAQMEALIIRDLSSGTKFDFIKYFTKQFTIVATMAGIIAVALYIISLFLHGLPMISLVISISLFISCLMSVFASLIIPYVFKKLRFDPADVSGPMATVIQDIMSVLVYFSVATLLLN